MTASSHQSGTGGAPDDGLPVAPPLARPNTPANPQDNAAGDADREPKQPSGVTPDAAGLAPGPDRESAARRYVRRLRLQDLEATLSSRDWQVLALVAQHGFVSTHQVQGFCFAEHASPLSAARSTRRVLARLSRDGLLRCLPRRQGGLLAGSAPSTWQLAPAGARLLSPDGGRYRTRTPSLWHLRHCLALADVHLQFRHLAQARGEHLEVAVEHAARRRIDGLGGERVWLKPDLAVRLSGHDQHGPYQDGWLVEVDLGTESLPTLLRKCQAYETYRASGREQDQTGSFPLVLWVMGGPKAAVRQQQLTQALVRSDAYSPGLYRFAALGDIAEVVGGVDDPEPAGGDS